MSEISFLERYFHFANTTVLVDEDKNAKDDSSLFLVHFMYGNWSLNTLNISYYVTKSVFLGCFFFQKAKSKIKIVNKSNKFRKIIA